jgi:hypothetical protein
MADAKTVFEQVVNYPAAPADLEQAKKRDTYGLVGAFAGAVVGGVLLGTGGAILGAPAGLKVGHVLASKMG